MKTIDLSAVLDDGDWSFYQKLLVAATALTIILDGFDNQLLGGAVPSLMKEWNLPRAAFSPVLTSGFVGMVFGGFLGGYLGDRMGRRVALLSSLLVFGVLTFLIAFAGNLFTLGVLRFFAGLGLGGAMPNAAALSSEYVPTAPSAVRGDAHDRVHSPRRRAGRPRRRADSAAVRLANPLSASAASSRSSWPSRCSRFFRSRRAFWPGTRLGGTSWSRCCAGWATTCPTTRCSWTPRRKRSPTRRRARSSYRSTAATRWCSARVSSSACCRSTWGPPGYRRS